MSSTRPILKGILAARPFRLPLLCHLKSRSPPFTSHLASSADTLSSNPHHPTTGHQLLIKKTTKMTAADSQDPIELCKAEAARSAVDNNINSDCVVGIGSGSTMQYVVERIRQKCLQRKLSIKCIPSSFQAKQLIYKFKLPLSDLDEHPVIDVTIDGADEMDENFVAIKGGGACLSQEKVIAAASRKFIVVADYRKDSKCLGDSWKKGIPVEVLPMSFNFVRHHIASKFSNTQPDDLVLRIGREKAGPVITDNGNFVLDWKFKQERQYSQEDWKTLSDRVKLIPGVVETGIFAGMVHEAYFGQQDGSVRFSSSPAKTR